MIVVFDNLKLPLGVDYIYKSKGMKLPSVKILFDINLEIFGKIGTISLPCFKSQAL